MSETMIAIENQSELVKKDILTRYMEINEVVSSLMMQLTSMNLNRYIISSLDVIAKTEILELIGICTIYDSKFYSEISSMYLVYAGHKQNYTTKKKARYSAESTIEIWEILKQSMNEYNIVRLKGD